MIESATLLNSYGKPAPQSSGAALSNLLTMPLCSGLGDKKARLDYGFPYLFGGVATSNDQGGLFILAQIANRADACHVGPALNTKERLVSLMSTLNLPHPAQNGQTPKAIETEYNGFKHRSRIEARFAVFFFELGVSYSYEVEGYDLGEAGFFLPDFWLPDSETFVEIKAQKPTAEEINKARAMHEQSGKDVVILYGDKLEALQIGAVIFPEDRIGNAGPCPPSSCALRFIKYLSYCELRKSARRLLTHLDCLSSYPEVVNSDLDRSISQPLVIFKHSPNAALTLARQARFEHGRNGA